MIARWWWKYGCHTWHDNTVFLRHSHETYCNAFSSLTIPVLHPGTQKLLDMHYKSINSIHTKKLVTPYKNTFRIIEAWPYDLVNPVCPSLECGHTPASRGSGFPNGWHRREHTNSGKHDTSSAQRSVGADRRQNVTRHYKSATKKTTNNLNLVLRSYLIITWAAFY